MQVLPASYCFASSGFLSSEWSQLQWSWESEETYWYSLYQYCLQLEVFQRAWDVHIHGTPLIPWGLATRFNSHSVLSTTMTRKHQFGAEMTLTLLLHMWFLFSQEVCLQCDIISIKWNLNYLLVIVCIFLGAYLYVSWLSFICVSYLGFPVNIYIRRNASA